jgi:hypothetical protein
MRSWSRRSTEPRLHWDATTKATPLAASEGITVRELAEEAGVPEHAVVLLARTLGQVLEHRPLSEETVRRAALLACRARRGRKSLGRCGHPHTCASSWAGLPAAGGRAPRGTPSDPATRRHRSAAVSDFQFDDGVAVEPLIGAFWTVADAAAGEWTAASWCVEPDPALEGRSPGSVGARRRRGRPARDARATGRRTPGSVNLTGFPRRTVRAGAPAYRIHRAGRGGWWFSSDGSGRFDPVGTGQGACHLAEKPLGAWVEVLRRRMLLEEEIGHRLLLAVTLGRASSSPT